MKNRVLFQEGGQVVRTRSRRGHVAFTVCAVVVLLGLNAWGTADELKVMQELADDQAAAAAFEAGRERGRAEMAQALPRGGCANINLTAQVRP